MNVNEKYSNHDDIKTAVQTFVRHYKSTNNVTVTDPNLEDKIVCVGGNFCSGILRLKFRYRTRHDNRVVTDSVLLKIPSLSVNYKQILEVGMYDNEMYVYQHLLPRLYKLWHGERFSPIFYASTDAKVLILEDLTKSGFQPGNKKIKLDLVHARAALTMLAKYHAVTVKYLQQTEGEREAISQSLIEPIKRNREQHPSFFHFYDGFLELTTIKVKTTESIRQKLRAFREQLEPTLFYNINSDHNGLTVIAHGDFWTSNILFQHDDSGEITATRMVDWQISRKTSPMIDVIYLFITALPFDVFKSNQETLINGYLQTLNDTLSSLECKCTYTRAQFDQDMQAYRHLYLNLLINALPLIMQGEELFGTFQVSKNASTDYVTFIENWLHYLDSKDFL